MLKETRKRTAETPGTSPEIEGRNPERYGDGASSGTVRKENFHPGSMSLMEAVVERGNMWEAYRKVVGNKGAAGVDTMTVEELKPCLQKHWPETKEKLVNGSYQPQPVLRVEIPKPGGGIRKLGIPTVLDRLIQQALLQVLSPLFDPDFSESSYGFRPGRSAQQAVLKAREHVTMTRRWVVDIDLEKFFDRVNHDILMSRVARKVKDRRVLRLIRRYLQAGIMMDGIVAPSREGTPQGGNLSPLLSNILLDELDKELERRGHTFCRYADDCNIYVRSKRAGERVYVSITRFLENRLKLRVNGDKSAIDRPWKRKFLGYSMTWHTKPKLRVAEESVARFKEKLKEQFRRGRGRNIGKLIEELRLLLIGWINYFSLAEVKGTFEELDSWIRRKLRAIIWRQWKRKFTRRKNLMKRGLSEEQASKSAYNGRGAWWNAGASHMNLAFPKKYFDTCGLISLLDLILDFQRSL
jgi:RNA-directed DNA polymerase